MTDKETKREQYIKKLKDPRWQKKRLAIMNRDNFTCQYCLDTETTLNVHHYYYGKGDPWEVPDEALITLCEDCHESETVNRYEFERELLDRLKYSRATLYQLDMLGSLLFDNERIDVVISTLRAPGCYAIAKAMRDQDWEEFRRLSEDALKS